MSDITPLPQNDSFIFNEMLVHPALFIHPKPHRIALVGNNDGAFYETLKHPQVVELVYVHQTETQVEDQKVKHFTTEKTWLETVGQESLDIIIYTEPPSQLDSICALLKKDGILIYPALLSLLHLTELKKLYEHTKELGYPACQLLHFPQPSRPPGWQTIIMATKQPFFKRAREIDIFNRPFTTRYYNYDMHKASLGIPEFLREEFVDIS